ncbi:MAG TPA: hypothetical protein VF297_17300 [Pyrinomonadaceae bacterium]
MLRTFVAIAAKDQKFVCRDRGGQIMPDQPRTLMGMSSPEATQT